ncbi:HEAT repeat domain-containing protein [Zhenpiania hominis]|uniref:HEAT repeat domain-containing protein n=1 Tax=Zhenpiania hominis TaxID=2763644 RepID=A0A923NNF6_9FIRM|nr:hypothetical protein [Zhenpiania hominis]MBC6679790.1 hypothetical protein [Zhenpiania hominis]
MHELTESYTAVLYLFIFFCLCLCVYNLYETVRRYSWKKQFRHKVQKELACLRKDLAQIKADRRVTFRLSGFRSRKLLIFHAAFCMLAKNRVEDESLRALACARIEQYIRLCTHRQILVKNYLIYLIGYHHTESPAIAQFLLDCLEIPSTLTRMEVLRSLAKLADIHLFIHALQKLDTFEAPVNTKLISDTLSDFEGSHTELSKALLLLLDSCSNDIKLGIITFFYSNDAPAVRDKLLQMFSDQTSHKEVRLRLMRYFGTVPDSRARPILIRFALSDTWEYAAISAGALRSYPGDETAAALKQRLNDSNWHVRYNCAQTLAQICTRGELEDVLESPDLYAREIMNYALNRKETVTREHS